MKAESRWVTCIGRQEKRVKLQASGSTSPSGISAWQLPQRPTPVSVSEHPTEQLSWITGHTPSAGVTGKSKRECFLCKVEPQGCRCLRLRAFLETKHFHGSFGPWAIFLLKKWEKFPHTDGKKNNFSWANPKTKAFLKPRTERRVGGRAGEQPLILSQHWKSLLALFLFARA